MNKQWYKWPDQAGGGVRGRRRRGVGGHAPAGVRAQTGAVG